MDSGRAKDPSKRSQQKKERKLRELIGQPAWKISPISAGYDRLWPLRDFSIPVQIPEDPSFTIPAADDKRTSRQLYLQICEVRREISQDSMSEKQIELLTDQYKKIFFTDRNHVLKFTPSQLLQLLYLFLNNFTVQHNGKKTMYLRCACKLEKQNRCSVAYAIHYDAQNDLYYVRPTKDIDHNHDLDVAIRRILSFGYGAQEGTRSSIGRRANILAYMSGRCIPVDIPEDNRFSLILTEQMDSQDIVSKLRVLLKILPKVDEIHPSIHKTFERFFSITDETFHMSPSQLCQFLQVYQNCLKIDANTDRYTTNLFCSPAVFGSSVNLGKCDFRFTITPDHIRQQFYISYLGGRHTHGIEYCALKCGIDSSIFGVSEVKPRQMVAPKSKSKSKSKVTKLTKTRKGVPRKLPFRLNLSFLEIANSSEPVDIPDDPSFHFQIDPSMTANDLISSLKAKYFMRVKPAVFHPSIHRTLAQVFYIKHQIYRFTISQLCQLLFAYRECFWLIQRKNAEHRVVTFFVFCSRCRARCILTADFEKQVFYWRKNGDPLAVQQHPHSFEETIKKAGLEFDKLSLNLKTLIGHDDLVSSHKT
ncbi:unnamed protein product [Ambrosiozyma monospora]|uniref:Unnamed protein product n=1 Tax=Ambrosiozyma monospora TaxID=43982 RepID=A0A9W6YXJ9_AMBMO|nr:unnamed protein product [Ambrosiozyma monospora]